jgi:hypothetical protein
MPVPNDKQFLPFYPQKRAFFWNVTEKAAAR